MLRCANTGVTAALDACGRTVHPDGGRAQVLLDSGGGHFTRGWLLAEVDVPLRAGWSLYAAAGDWLVVVLGLGGMLAGHGRRNVPSSRQRKDERGSTG